MNRTQLEHVLRAASQIAGEPDVLVIGSQSILGGLPENRLPIEAISSIEVDVTFSLPRSSASTSSTRWCSPTASRFSMTFTPSPPSVSLVG